MSGRRSRLAFWITVTALLGGLGSQAAAPCGIAAFSRNGTLTWTNARVPGICTVEKTSSLQGSWIPERNAFSTASSSKLVVGLTESPAFYRVRSVDVSATLQGFTNWINCYGLLETIIGSGLGQLDVSYWQTWYEGGLAQQAALSRPHFAMADRAGNIYVADKNSHSILRVSPEGILTTLAGTHTSGFNGEGPALATTLQLNFPNGEWVRSDGTVYILDTGNGRVRRVNTNGMMVTLFKATSDGSPVNTGRGLWVKDDESLAYFCAGTKVKKWTPAGGLQELAVNFVDLGDLMVNTAGEVIVCDRGASLVYRISLSGARTIIAGNGTSTGGGDGFPAVKTGLYGVRGVWPVPTGGYLLLTHEGCQLWYLDQGGTVRVLLNGSGGRTHSGDGAFFYGPGLKISEGRSVTMDYEGNILICESDYGYVRRIRFLRLAP
jgi:hypothetical protein